MSWDSYRDSLTGSGLVQKAAICGVTDGSVWSQSPDFNLSQQEVKSIINGFHKPDHLRQNGILIGGEKYLFLQSDENQIQGKKGTDGVSISCSAKCVIIGKYTDGQQPGNCRLQVDRMRDYLLSNQF